VIKLARLIPINLRNCLLVELKICLRMKSVIISVISVILSRLLCQLIVKHKRAVDLHLLNSKIMMLLTKLALNLELLLVTLK